MEKDYEIDGPILIKYGFLRNSEGSWDRLSIFDRLEVKKLQLGPNAGNWGLVLSVYHNDLFSSFVNFSTREEAQKALDHIFSGGIIRFKDGKPYLC